MNNCVVTTALVITWPVVWTTAGAWLQSSPVHCSEGHYGQQTDKGEGVIDLVKQRERGGG